MTQRKDKLRNKAKVIKEVLKNPELTQKEIEEKTWLWHWTVNRNVQELDKNGHKIESEIIDRICQNDRELIDLVAWLNVKVAKKIINKWEVDINELKTLNDITDKSTKRYTLFKWDITDKEWGLKNPLIDRLYEIWNNN